MRQLSHTRGGQRARVQLNGLIVNIVSAIRHRENSERESDLPLNIVTTLDRAVGELDLAVGDVSRALLNLVHNAVYAVRNKQAPVPGWIPQVEIETSKLPDAVRITIRDNGDGIPPELHTKIFEPFFTTKPADRGIGLGLALAHDVIVQIHSGTITVDSEVGQYTAIHVTVPCEQARLAPT